MNHFLVITVDPQKWLETPTGEEEVFDDDTMAQPGWVPDTLLGGIARESLLCDVFNHIVKHDPMLISMSILIDTQSVRL